METISINFYFRKTYMFSTPHISIGFDNQTPFADWAIDIDIVVLFWSIQVNVDNSGKYYTNK